MYVIQGEVQPRRSHFKIGSKALSIFFFHFFELEIFSVASIYTFLKDRTGYVGGYDISTSGSYVLSVYLSFGLCGYVGGQPIYCFGLSLAWFIDAMPRIYSCLYMTLYSKCKSQQWLIIWVGNKTLRELSGAQTTENVPLFYFTNQQHP